ncbi:hypothetical protein HK405_001212, partial [Cladochytrium tenue]
MSIVGGLDAYRAAMASAKPEMAVAEVLTPEHLLVAEREEDPHYRARVLRKLDMHTLPLLV